MFVWAQHRFFDSGNGSTVEELAEIVDKSEATVRKKIKELSSLSFIGQKGERPAYYSIKQKFFEV